MHSAPETVAGFPDMWHPVYEKYKAFFDLAAELPPLINEMIHKPHQGRLLQTVARLTCVAANTNGAILTLVLNGYGHDAMKLARSIFEIELHILWFKKYPAEVDDFWDFNIIQQKRHYDLMDEEQKSQAPAERVAQMMQDYNAVLPRFADRKTPTRPRNRWCRESIYRQAKEVDRIELYRTFYAQASSLHHMDMGGLIDQMDTELSIELAPSWGLLGDALTHGMASFLRCLAEYDEIAQLGLKERLENGPLDAYVKAVRGL